MAFIEGDRRPGGLKGTLANGAFGESKETWEFFSDSLEDTPETLRASGLLPQPYVSRHPQNPTLICQPHEIEQDEEHPARFTVEITWSSEPISQEDQDQEEEDPFERRAKIRVRTIREKEVVHTDRKGKAKVNAAGDLFDPPIESNRSYLQIVITKNVEFFEDWVFDFVDAVNSVDFDIRGRTILAGRACIEEIELGEEQYTGDHVYCVATILMGIKKPREIRRNEEGDSLEFDELNNPVDYAPGPWQTEQLNEGLHAMVEDPDNPGTLIRKRIMVFDDQDPPQKQTAAAPVMLEWDGTILVDPPGPNTATYRVFDDHEYLDFNDIAYLWE